MNASPSTPASPLAGVSGAVVHIDRDGTVVDRNEEAVHLLGAPEPGGNLWAAIPDRLVSVLRAVAEAACRQDDRCVSTDHVPTSGSWCRVVATPVAGGVVLHVFDVGDLRSATERVRDLEAQARRRDEELHDLLAAWGMRVSYVDQDLRYTRIYNAPAAYPEHLYLGKRAYDFADGAAGHQIADFQLEVLTSGTGLRREISFHDGLRDRTWLVYGEPIRGGAGGVTTLELEVSGMREAEAAATTDFLTGVTNRRAMEALVRQETTRATRYGAAASVILLDVDHFKHVNDTFGHSRGDAVLRALVGRLHDELRAADVVGRWGGEEFLALLPETDHDEAAQVAERMRERVAAEPFDVVGHVTISLGVATRILGEEAAALVERADAACLRAKRLGRDRVVSAAADPGPSSEAAQPLFPHLELVAREP